MLSRWIGKNDGGIELFGRFGGSWFGQMVSVLVSDGVLGGPRVECELQTGGRARKIVRQKLAFEVKHKNRHVLGPDIGGNSDRHDRIRTKILRRLHWVTVC